MGTWDVRTTCTLASIIPMAGIVPVVRHLDEPGP